MIVSYINESIQTELEKRRRALARESNSPLELGTGGTKIFNEYLSRTPYVVMASNLTPAELNVAIGGGSSFNPAAFSDPEKFMEADGETRKTSGLPPLVNHMHGFKNNGTGAYRNTKSKGISPIPGIKDISVEYRGGYKGIREATVNWAVSNLEDLEFYTPHFLAIGRSVALEWGWTMFDTPNTHKFITYADASIEVDDELFTNPSINIIENKGNLDGMGGVVTNFNFKMRDDGGFDCTTTLNALGINFFGGDGLDSSGESGTGLILSKRDEITVLSAEGATTADKKKIKDKALQKINTEDHTNIIEELLNLPQKLHENTTEYVDFSNPNSKINVYRMLTEPDDVAQPVGAVDQDGNPLPTSKPINFFKYKHVIHAEGLNLDAKFDYAGNNFMIRWGWLEDNVFSKFTASTNSKAEIISTFRSVDSDGYPVEISYNKNLIPINPFSSMIYTTSIISSVDGGDFNGASDWGDVGRDDDYWPTFEKYFKKYMSLGADNLETKFNKNEDSGIMRNIYVSLTDVLESFGFDKDYAKTLVNPISELASAQGNYNQEFLTKSGASYYANSSQIYPPKTMESAINTLLKKINRNFHNYWKFNIVSDTETMDNIRIIDENYVAPNPDRGPDQSIDYTTFDTDGKIKTDENTSGLGIYKFPSFTVGSTVKSQTLEFKLPDAMKTVAMSATNAPKTDSPSNPLMKKFRALGAINKNPFIKADGEDGMHKLSDLKPVWRDNHQFGNSSAYPAGELTLNGNSIGRKNDWKYVKVTEETSTAAGSNLKLRKEAGGAVIRFKAFSQSKKNLEDAERQNQIAELIEADPDRYAYYIVDGKAGLIILKPEAITLVRSELGLVSDKNKSYLIPAELGLEIDGIAGIKPGNICHTDYIQRIYNERKGELGPNTFFQIFGITQKVTDDGWTTTLDTKMRLNGNALSASLDTSFADVLDMEFGTPAKDRQKAKTQSEVQAAINVGTDLTEEAAEDGVSAAELSNPEPTQASEDTGGEVTDEVVDEQEVEDGVPEVPVTTAITGPVEYEGSPEQNIILYKARPD